MTDMEMIFMKRGLTGEQCPICDWPMADSQANGCIPGDCCYRPDDPAEQRRISERRKALALTHADGGGGQ